MFSHCLHARTKRPLITVCFCGSKWKGIIDTPLVDNQTVSNDFILFGGVTHSRRSSETNRNHPFVVRHWKPKTSIDKILWSRTSTVYVCCNTCYLSSFGKVKC